MAWLCPKCKTLQHFTYRCKKCGYKSKLNLTSKKIQEMRKYKVPNGHWKNKKK